MSTYIDFMDSPVGWLKVVADKEAISELAFAKEKGGTTNPSEITKQCVGELEEYFDGARKHFSVPLKFLGTDFQNRVWNQLLKIPFGKTISYQQLAIALGDIKSVRAAGSANGKNPIAIIVPCHRVIGSDGSLIGYSGGLWRKRRLLEFESKNQQQQLF